MGERKAMSATELEVFGKMVPPRSALRKSSAPDFLGRTVILVDDGLATQDAPRRYGAAAGATRPHRRRNPDCIAEEKYFGMPRRCTI